jgi:putative MATE family efflux protein
MSSNSALDLTRGSILKNLVRLSAPIVFGMVVFTLYLLIDLYFVGRLGPHAVAAVSISSNAFFVVFGLNFVLGTGGMALIAQAFGKKDFESAGKVFQQSIVLCLIIGAVVVALGLAIARPYISFFGGVGDSFEWGVGYFRIFSIYSFFMLLVHVVMACYRGMGDTKTPMLISLQSIGINIALDPVLIFGLLGFPRLGVEGAAIATLVSQLYSLVVYYYLIFIKGSHLHLTGSWRPDPAIIKKSLAIGTPAGFTYFLLAFNLLITYRVISPYGTAALASLGIGFRILQCIYIPVVAVTSAMAAMIGQNFGAEHYGRISKTLRTGLWISSIIMLMGAIVCQLFPTSLLSVFSDDPEVIEYGLSYLTVMSLGTIMVGVIMATSSAFQGLGKTYPTFVGAVIDNALFACLVFTLPSLFGWGIDSVWWLKLFTGFVEMLIVAVWLNRELVRIRPKKALEVSPVPVRQFTPES